MMTLFLVHNIAIFNLDDANKQVSVANKAVAVKKKVNCLSL